MKSRCAFRVIAAFVFAAALLVAAATRGAAGTGPFLPDDPSWVYPPPGTPWNHEVGVSGFGPGDVNSDGFDDLLIGLRDYDYEAGVRRVSTSSVLLFYGQETGLPTEPGWHYQRHDSTSFSQYKAKGDLNGDHCGDIIITDYEWSEIDRPWRGRIFVFYGSISGPSASPDVVLKGDDQYDELGYQGVGDVDVNGDGYDDLYVTALKRMSGVPLEGVPIARIYFGGADGISEEPDWEIETNLCILGVFRISSINDVNGDGHTDITAYCDISSEEMNPFVHFYYGSASGPSIQPDLEIAAADPSINDWFSFEGVGDINGDGYDDVVTHAQISFSVKIFYGSPSGLDPTSSKDFHLHETIYDLPGDLSYVGDLDGDGFDELGMDDYSGTAAYIFGGSDSGPDKIRVWGVGNANLPTFWVSNPRAAGDLNDDGADDIVIVGVNLPQIGADDSCAFVYLGIPTTTTIPTSTTSTTAAEADDDAVDDDTVDDDSGLVDVAETSDRSSACGC